MIDPFEHADLEICALTVARLGGDEPDDVRAPLAWVIRNRLLSAALPPGAVPNLARTCRAILHEAVGGAGQLSPKTALTASDWCRLYAVNCLVWAGDLADPTAGATACHRHDITRSWARGRTPTALLGPYIFFR